MKKILITWKLLFPPLLVFGQMDIEKQHNLIGALIMGVLVIGAFVFVLFKVANKTAEESTVKKERKKREDNYVKEIRNTEEENRVEKYNQVMIAIKEIPDWIASFNRKFNSLKEALLLYKSTTSDKTFNTLIKAYSVHTSTVINPKEVYGALDFILHNISNDLNRIEVHLNYLDERYKVFVQNHEYVRSFQKKMTAMRKQALAALPNSTYTEEDMREAAYQLLKDQKKDVWELIGVARNLYSRYYDIINNKPQTVAEKPEPKQMQEITADMIKAS